MEEIRLLKTPVSHSNAITPDNLLSNLLFPAGNQQNRKNIELSLILTELWHVKATFRASFFSERKTFLNIFNFYGANLF